MDCGLMGRVAVVTGASAGIGRATARALAAEGAQVVLVARRQEALAEVATSIVGAGGTPPLTFQADLLDRDSTGRIVDAVAEAFGRLDVLANVAGGADRPSDIIDETHWEKQFELNFHAKRRLTEAFLPQLRASGQGRVINFAGLLEPSGVSAAQPAIAACVLWSKALAREVAADGVTVNCIAPGRIESEQVDRLYPTADSRAEFIDRRIPARRFGTADEAAALALFLASAPAAYVTGEMVSVDGGMHWSI